MRRHYLPLIAAVSLTFLNAGDCLAGIRPSFRLDHCAWHASDIVVVARNAGDGTLNVLETWKGSLAKGDSVVLPESVDYQPEVAELFSRPEDPTLMTGKRMILFLRRTAASPETSSVPTQPGIMWAGASMYKEMNVSMVWIENGQVYNFIQVINPGPSLLIARGQTEEQFTKDVEAVLAEQAKVQTLLAIKDPTERAKALKPIAAGRNTDRGGKLPWTA